MEHHRRGRWRVRPARHRHGQCRLHRDVEHRPHHGRQPAHRRAHRSGRRRQGQRAPDVVRLQRRTHPLPEPRRVRGIRQHHLEDRLHVRPAQQHLHVGDVEPGERFLRPARRRHRPRHDLLLGRQHRHPRRQHGAGRHHDQPRQPAERHEHLRRDSHRCRLRRGAGRHRVRRLGQLDLQDALHHHRCPLQLPLCHHQSGERDLLVPRGGHGCRRQQHHLGRHHRSRHRQHGRIGLSGGSGPVPRGTVTVSATASSTVGIASVRIQRAPTGHDDLDRHLRRHHRSILLRVEHDHRRRWQLRPARSPARHGWHDHHINAPCPPDWSTTVP